MQVVQLPNIKLQNDEKVYFASDFHFGIPNKEESDLREKRVVSWLDGIKKYATHIFLVGDLFDTWIEYKTVIPKGNTRFLGKLAELSDMGISLYIFTGNHDLWMYGYFEEELRIRVLHSNAVVTINNQRFFVGHGDGLGPGDKKYKFLKAVLNNSFCQWLYGSIHPDIGVKLAMYFSKKGANKKYKDLNYLGDEKEHLFQFCKSYHELNPVDYFVFGHRHIKLQKQIDSTCTYFNLGDWISYNSYLEVSKDTIDLKTFTI